MQEAFRKFSYYFSNTIGSVWAFLLFMASLWISGHYFDYSDRWKTNVSFIIAIVTLTALIFLQKSQNHNDQATHLKLDEMIRAAKGARDEVAAVEEQSSRDMEQLKKKTERVERNVSDKSE